MWLYRFVYCRYGDVVRLGNKQKCLFKHVAQHTSDPVPIFRIISMWGIEKKILFQGCDELNYEVLASLLNSHTCRKRKKRRSTHALFIPELPIQH